MKFTAIAPSNIALIKYWGRVDEKLRIPTNDSISFNLSNLNTTTTVEFSNKYNKDEIQIEGYPSNYKYSRVIEHLDRVRKIAGIATRAKVVSKNSFPGSTGLSSSASGFAALTLAAASAAGLAFSEKELSILARQGSGSACRSIPAGFVQWHKGVSNKTSYAESIFPPKWWDIVDIVVVVSSQVKDVPTSEAQKNVYKNPFFKTRLANIDKKINALKHSIKKRDFTQFGEIVESEALELHSIMMTSNPSLIYLYPQTVRLMHKVRSWRKEGKEVYFTINTGHNIHLIIQKKDLKEVSNMLKKAKFQHFKVNNIGDRAKSFISDLF